MTCGAPGDKHTTPCDSVPINRGVGFPYCECHWQERQKEEYDSDKGDPGLPEEEEDDDEDCGDFDDE